MQTMGPEKVVSSRDERQVGTIARGTGVGGANPGRLDPGPKARCRASQHFRGCYHRGIPSEHRERVF